MSSSADSAVTETPLEEEAQVNLSGVIAVLVRERRSIALTGLALAVVTAIISSLIKPSYTAEATFLPPNSISTGASLLPGSLLGQLGSGASPLSALKDPTLLYIGVLSSRSVADKIIEQFHLAEVYKTHKLSDTEKRLAAHTKFSSAKSNITTILFTDHDPKRAADIANAYLSILHDQNSRLALTESAQKRAYFQAQLEKEKNALSDAETELARLQEKTGLIQPNSQAQLQMQTIVRTQAELASREVELNALSQGATDQNPTVVRLRSEIAGLREQLKRLQLTDREGDGNIQVPTSKVPQLSVLYMRKARDLRYHEELYQLLMQQYGAASLDEARSAPMLQVVDQAIVPDTKSWPPRTLLTIAGFLLGMLARGAWLVFGRTLVQFFKSAS